MIDRTCQRCKKIFKVTPRRAKIAACKFCSMECYGHKKVEKIIHPCEFCGKSIKTLPTKMKNGHGRFCSLKCFGKSKITLVDMKCVTCSSEYQVEKNVIERNQGKFCSRKCFHASITREKHPEWTGKKPNLYQFVTVHGHPYAKNLKRPRIPKHRVVAESILGRYLTKGEVIHHIDEIPKNNKPENLYLFENDAAHAKYHKDLFYGHCLKITKSNLHADTNE